MILSDLQVGEQAIIVKIKGRGAFRKRITEMGFVKGKKVKLIKRAPLKDPVIYEIMGYEVSLRNSEASLIEVITELEIINNIEEHETENLVNEEFLLQKASEKGKTINIALVGNPNCGKTTLFNHASGSQEHVGNYSGVTVDAKSAKFKHKGYTIKIVDLPGTYSLSAYSPEELYVRNYIFSEFPDIVINVIDSSNLERNLYLTTQLIDMDIKAVIALNMYDELEKKGDKFDFEKFGKMVGFPVTPTVSSRGRGIYHLMDKVIELYEDNEPYYRHIHINYGHNIEERIKLIQEKIKINNSLTDKFSSRFLAIKLLEKDKNVNQLIESCENKAEILSIVCKSIDLLENNLKEDSETLVTDAKYGFIAGALKETYKGGTNTNKNRSKIIDSFLTHKIFGFPLFIVIMWIMFQATFTLGKYPMGWIDSLVNLFGNWIDNNLAASSFKDLLIDGVIHGVGGVIVFLPNILILFFFISLMEDTGYLARAAFIVDKLMHKIGLHGKSFIPLIMGFGCNVPAIMATRTIESKNDRILTILINPFMSCSARLPVYILIIGAVFPSHPGNMLFAIYIFGIILAALMAILFKKTFFRTKDIPFVMELPPYRMPTLRNTTKHMWSKATQYLKKMSGVILVAAIIVWALGYFPRETKYTKDYLSIKQKLEKELINKSNTSNVNFINDEIRNINNKMKAEHLENSYIGRIGKFIEPVMRPLGFDWRMSVSLVAGITGKEIVVSTLGVLFQADGAPGLNNQTLIYKLRNATIDSNSEQKLFNPLTALSYLVFVLVYFPCVAAIAAVRKETGTWKWAAFTVFYSTALAWFLAFLIQIIGNLF
ncbi:MAG: ferrous iron transport protein B [Bacteroidia bacterium]|nr:ferrous iron transport protein B [Bacteroidia bacterium]